MDILIAGEESQIITEQFILRGHNAISCDKYYPGAKGLPHYQGDVRDLLDIYFDLVIFHPVCKYLSNSGVRWLHSDPTRYRKMREACDFFNLRDDFNSPRVATENPVVHCYAKQYIGEQSQTFQPWQHGHKEIKRTCLWLKGLPLLIPSNIVGPPPKDRDKSEWDKVHRCSPGPDRERIRSRTLEGVAIAMAEQWSNF